MDVTRTLVLACATVIEDMLPILPEGMRYQILDFGLHVNPGELRTALQEGIDQADADINTILLGYGLCSQAVLGVKSDRCTLVVPKVDDCIAIFMGGKKAYKEQQRQEPGTYYLTKGWIEVGSTPFTEYEGMVKSMGEEKAKKVQKLMLGNYKRLALINTGQDHMDAYREYSRNTADKFNLHYEEISGSNALLQKMLSGQWDDEFIVVKPGEAITFTQFFE